MKNSNFNICDVNIHPGESTSLALPLPEFYSCTSLYMPIKVVHGKQAGPCLLIFSAVKGDELNGIEIINQLLESISPDKIAGTLIAIPVLNVFNLVTHSNRVNYEASLDTCFPGDENGSYGERIAHVFTQEILSKVNYCIELQTGSLNHEILPQIYCELSNPDARRIAKHFQAPVITNVSMHSNTLRTTTEKLNIPLLVYQAGEAKRFNESAIRLGLNGLQKVLSALKMHENTEDNNTSQTFKPIFSEDQDWIRAHRSGVLHCDVELGAMIKEGQKIGRINDPFSSDTAETVKSPLDGIVVGINRNPLIHEGQTIFKVASFIDNDKAESVIEAWGDLN